MPFSRKFHVYILASKSRRLYVGMTNDLFRRVLEHKTGEVEGFTKRYRINRLVYFEFYKYVTSCIAREKQIKSWSRAKKIALIQGINPTWEDLAAEWGKPIQLLTPKQIPQVDDTLLQQIPESTGNEMPKQIPHFVRNDKALEQMPQSIQRDKALEQIPHFVRNDKVLEQMPQFMQSDKPLKQIPHSVRNDKVLEQMPQSMQSDKPLKQIPHSVRNDKALEQMPQSMQSDKPLEQIPHSVRNDKALEQMPQSMQSDKALEQIPHFVRNDKALAASRIYRRFLTSFGMTRL